MKDLREKKISIKILEILIKVIKEKKENPNPILKKDKFLKKVNIKSYQNIRYLNHLLILMSVKRKRLLILMKLNM